MEEPDYPTDAAGRLRWLAGSGYIDSPHIRNLARSWGDEAAAERDDLAARPTVPANDAAELQELREKVAFLRQGVANLDRDELIQRITAMDKAEWSNQWWGQQTREWFKKGRVAERDAHAAKLADELERRDHEIAELEAKVAALPEGMCCRCDGPDMGLRAELKRLRAERDDWVHVAGLGGLNERYVRTSPDFTESQRRLAAEAVGIEL